METRAPYVLTGSFVLAAILAVFGFVYWLNNSGGIGPRTNYHVQFQGPVPGLLVGAGVLFIGIRFGEVTQLGLAADNPRFVNATISVASTTPVRTDTKVGLDFQGLTGVPVVTLVGETVVGRAGLSQLTNLGLTELVATTPEQFVRIGVELACNLPRLAALRRSLRQRMEESPLMDASRFARNIEVAYRGMWGRWCSSANG